MNTLPLPKNNDELAGYLTLYDTILQKLLKRLLHPSASKEEHHAIIDGIEQLTKHHADQHTACVAGEKVPVEWASEIEVARFGHAQGTEMGRKALFTTFDGIRLEFEIPRRIPRAKE